MKTWKNVFLAGIGLSLSLIVLIFATRAILAYAEPPDYDRWLVQKTADDFWKLSKMPAIITNVSDMQSIDKKQLESRSGGVATEVVEFMLVRKERRLILWTYGKVGVSPQNDYFVKDLSRTQKLATFGELKGDTFVLGIRINVDLPVRTDLSNDSLPALRMFYQNYRTFFDSLNYGLAQFDPDTEVDRFRAYVFLMDDIAYITLLTHWVLAAGLILFPLSGIGSFLCYRRFHRGLTFKQETMSDNLYHDVLREFPTPGFSQFFKSSDPAALRDRIAVGRCKRMDSVAKDQGKARLLEENHREIDLKLDELIKEIGLRHEEQLDLDAAMAMEQTEAALQQKKRLMEKLRARKREKKEIEEAPFRKRRELEEILFTWVSAEVPTLPDAKQLLDISRELPLAEAKTKLTEAIVIQRKAYKDWQRLQTRADHV